MLREDRDPAAAGAAPGAGGGRGRHGKARRVVPDALRRKALLGAGVERLRERYSGAEGGDPPQRPSAADLQRGALSSGVGGLVVGGFDASTFVFFRRVIDSVPHVLLLERLDGFMDIAGGKPVWGETVWQALRREVSEEMSSVDIEDEHFTKWRAYPPFTSTVDDAFTVFGFECHVDPELELTVSGDDQHVTQEWVPVSELLTRHLRSDIRALVYRLMQPAIPLKLFVNAPSGSGKTHFVDSHGKFFPSYYDMDEIPEVKKVWEEAPPHFRQDKELNISTNKAAINALREWFRTRRTTTIVLGNLMFARDLEPAVGVIDALESEAQMIVNSRNPRPFQPGGDEMLEAYRRRRLDLAVAVPFSDLASLSVRTFQTGHIDVGSLNWNAVSELA